jgi:hypothetical protein
MSTFIREELFLVDEVEVVYDYKYFNNFDARYKATSLNTLPPNYGKGRNRYKRKPYKDPNDGVRDVYDGMGSYEERRRKAFRKRCENCGEESDKAFYIIKDNVMKSVCSWYCAEEIKKGITQLPKKPLYTERSFNPVAEVTGDMTIYACKICKKVPVDYAHALTIVHEEGTSDSQDIYTMTCSLQCALKEIKEKKKRELLY